jgi:hypothetical protein
MVRLNVQVLSLTFTLTFGHSPPAASTASAHLLSQQNLSNHLHGQLSTMQTSLKSSDKQDPLSQSSQNKYSGEWADKKRNGFGIMNFVNGDTVDMYSMFSNIMIYHHSQLESNR